MHRQKSYRELPTKTKWWKEFEPVLISGLRLRLIGHVAGDPEFAVHAARPAWKDKIAKLISDAEVTYRRLHGTDSCSDAHDVERDAGSDPS